jgi:vacuolar-type H+-ATPase subunit I/STV1
MANNKSKDKANLKKQNLRDSVVEITSTVPNNVDTEAAADVKTAMDVADTKDKIDQVFDNYEKNLVENDDELRKNINEGKKLAKDYDLLPKRNKKLEEEGDDLLDESKTPEKDFETKVDQEASKVEDKKKRGMFKSV